MEEKADNHERRHNGWVVLHEFISKLSLSVNVQTDGTNASRKERRETCLLKASLSLTAHERE
jgi:hypothetical protein